MFNGMTFKNMPVNIVLSKSAKRVYKKRIGSYVRRRSDGREFEILKHLTHEPGGSKYALERAGNIHEIVSYYKLKKYYS